MWDPPSPTHPPLAIRIIEPLFMSISKKHCCCKIKPTNSHWWKWLNLTANIDKVCHIHINPKNTAKSHNKNGSLDAKVPSYKFDEVKLENKINHFDKYRREMCAEAVTAIVNVLVERLTNAISQTLCPSEIWFAKKIGNMVCLEQRNPDAEHEQQQHRCDHLSSPATAAGWRGGEGCSHPAAHQIGRSTISNSAGNSWDIFINVLKVFRRSVMQCCQWIAPPSRARLDCRHCIFISPWPWSCRSRFP